MQGDVAAVRRRYERELAPPLVTGSRALVDSGALLWRCHVTGSWSGPLPSEAVCGSAPGGWLISPPTPFAALHAALSLAAESDEVGLAALLKAGRVSKVVCSFPRTANSTVFPELYRSGRTKLELVPQGTLAERIRAGGAGIPAFYTPSAVGTPLAEGKESREFGGRKYLLEHGLRADFSFIKGRVADTHGNILYNKTARNFNPLMAMAAKVTIVQVAEVVEPGELDPESIVTPGIFVDRVVAIANPAHESELVEAGASYP